MDIKVIKEDVLLFHKSEIMLGINDLKTLLEPMSHYRLIKEKLFIPIRSIEEYQNLPDEKNGFGEVRYRKTSMNVDMKKHILHAVYIIKPKFAYLANTYVKIK